MQQLAALYQQRRSNSLLAYRVLQPSHTWSQVLFQPSSMTQAGLLCLAVSYAEHNCRFAEQPLSLASPAAQTI